MGPEFGRKYWDTVTKHKRVACSFITKLKVKTSTFRLYVHILHSDVRSLPS